MNTLYPILCSSQGYLQSLGLARTAQVKCDARIGEAEARRDAGIREAEAEEQRVAGRLLNDIEIAKAKRDFELQNASYQKEVQARKAESDMAYELQVSFSHPLPRDSNFFRWKVSTNFQCPLLSTAIHFSYPTSTKSLEIFEEM